MHQALDINVEESSHQIFELTMLLWRMWYSNDLTEVKDHCEELLRRKEQQFQAQM
jgi:hypothetical protein